MDVAEFDRFADEYLTIHAKNLVITGEGPDYFARYKVDEVKRVWRARGLPDPGAILDFGSGIGGALPHLRTAFPAAEIIATDVSTRSLEIAEHRHPGVARFVRYEGSGPPAPDASVDLAYSACVFHHIDEREHLDLFRSLRRTLKPGGALVVYEHNPINPVTRYIVATCPFDENAVLIPAGRLRRRLLDAGFSKIEIAYLGFFPAALSALRPLDPLLRRVPIGAQYYALAHA
ncbi:MAG TPA: methyltransferase domain-containing protein [Caulobacteraceae bacterium]|jgi:SAM-dependent methyltransferase|nr:methyltransferase domain-containing protein [Caulobacteraceae bacterium]